MTRLEGLELWAICLGLGVAAVAMLCRAGRYAAEAVRVEGWR